MRPSGLVTVSRIVDGFGKEIPIDKAIHYGWIQPGAEEEVPNLFVDQGRQLLAYAFAFRSPIEDYTCSKFGVGIGTTAAKVTDVGLESPVNLSSGDPTGPVDSIDFLTAFVVRVSFTLGLSDANGSLLTEMGLFSGNDSLLARRVRSVGINKTSDFAPTLTWRVRF